MKKLFLLIAFTALTATVANAQFSIGAGYVNSVNKMKMKAEILGVTLNETETHSMNGFYVGADYNIRIWNGLSIEPGLNYSFLGASETDEGVKITTSEHFLNIPAMFRYTFDITDNFKVFGFAGPKFVVGLAAIEKHEEDGESESMNAYTGDEASLSRFDVQLGFGAGVQFRSFYFKTGYDWGLVNRVKTDIEGITMKRSQFYAGVGFVF